MKPIPGKIYAGRSGRAREVVRLENYHQSIGLFGDTFDVVYRSVLGGGRRGKERKCWCQTWNDWVRGPIPEHQA